MKALRVVCTVILAAGLTAGCGGDDEETTPTTAFTPSQTTAVGGSPTTAVSQGVTDGAICPRQGDQGTTKDGLAMVCDLLGGQLRWRPR